MCNSFVKIKLLRNKKFKERKCAFQNKCRATLIIACKQTLLYFSIIGEREKENKELVVFISISFFPHLYPLTLAVI